MFFTPGRFKALGAGVILASTTILIPATASATPVNSVVPAHEGAPHCMVESGTLNWGVKTSFRTYITGAIANGTWQNTPGVEYVAPSLSETGAVDPLTDLFSWSDASGEVESSLDGGSVDFTGELFFEGHNGSLQLTVANPAIEFDGSDAYLLLTLGDSDGSGPAQIRAGKLDLTGATETTATELVITQAPLRLTAEGAAGLNGTKGYGTYVTGQEMDPLSLNALVSGCELGAIAQTPVDGEESQETAEANSASDSAPADTENTSSDVPWLPVIAGGVGVLVIAGAATMLVRGRNKGEKTTPTE